MERTKNIYPALIPWLDPGQPLALATILETKGSTPQIPGASALFSEHGLLLGTLGGGILEADAQKRALLCLNRGRSIIYQFKLHGDAMAGEEALCGGSASILIDAFPVDHLNSFKRLKTALRRRRSGLLATRIECRQGREVAIERIWLENKKNAAGSTKERWPIDPVVMEEIRREGRPRLISFSGTKAAESKKEIKKRGAEKGMKKTLLFLEPLSPLPRLVIAGAGHVGRAVAHLGQLLDFEVNVIDDRAEFANPERFPEAEKIIVGDIGRALAGFPSGSDIYIVIVTRGHRDDAAALRACVKSSFAYIGMIGSRRKIALMREEFIAEGWSTAQAFDRVHAPIGLPIGSKTVEEIAVSIAAELVQARSGGAGGKTGESR
jgi:xanthine dehydrogenase accessory factor